MTREEAIKIIESNCSCSDSKLREACAMFIPELKESEDERIRKEINTLYSEIDYCITELLKARTDKDSEAEGKALFKMEGLMVATLQDLSCIEDYLEKQKECLVDDSKASASEDEKIRKSIIRLLQVGGYMSPEEKNNAFAYLEKQKDLFKDGVGHYFYDGNTTYFIDAPAMEKLTPVEEPCKENANSFTSKDERIRKEIVEYFERYSGGDNVSIKFPKWIAYLEKRKEQKSINESNMHEPTLDEARKWNEAYEKGYSLGYKNGRNEQKPAQYDLDVLEKHITKDSISELAHTVMIRNGWEIVEKEQKPAECIVSPPSDPFMFNLHSIIYNFGKQVAAECLDTHILDTELNEYVTDEDVDKYIKKHISCLVKYHPLQKPTKWSKEDDAIHTRVLGALGKAFMEVLPTKPSQEDIEWFKSLPERFNLQPNQEWSEEYREEDLRTRFAFYTYKDEDSVLYLSNVFVEETSRNKGFGTKILAAAEKVAETLGAIQIRLKVKQDSSANAWYRKHGYGYMAFEDGYDWLEKNLEYMKPIKSEWNEEDKKLCQKTIEWLEEKCFPYALDDNNPARDCIVWLKSLRSQSHWKPSEAEVKALEGAYLFWRGATNRTPDIRSLELLYDDLKKL